MGKVLISLKEKVVNLEAAKFEYSVRVKAEQGINRRYKVETVPFLAPLSRRNCLSISRQPLAPLAAQMSTQLENCVDRLRHVVRLVEIERQ